MNFSQKSIKLILFILVIVIKSGYGSELGYDYDESFFDGHSGANLTFSNYFFNLKDNFLKKGKKFSFYFYDYKDIYHHIDYDYYRKLGMNSEYLYLNFLSEKNVFSYENTTHLKLGAGFNIYKHWKLTLLAVPKFEKKDIDFSIGLLEWKKYVILEFEDLLFNSKNKKSGKYKQYPFGLNVRIEEIFDLSIDLSTGFKRKYDEEKNVLPDDMIYHERRKNSIDMIIKTDIFDSYSELMYIKYLNFYEKKEFVNSEYNFSFIDNRLEVCYMTYDSNPLLFENIKLTILYRDVTADGFKNYKKKRLDFIQSFRIPVYYVFNITYLQDFYGYYDSITGDNSIFQRKKYKLQIGYKDYYDNIEINIGFDLGEMKFESLQCELHF